ncbi:PHD finger protein 21A [Pleodorina starrii]|nr:PHD finger protein 21A [Pleodorina starrii]
MAAWQRYGYDSPTFRNEAAWSFHTQPQPCQRPDCTPPLAHRRAMGRHFDQLLLAAGITERYDPQLHGSRDAFAAVVSPLHVVTKADGDIRPVIDPSASGVNACMDPLPCPLPDLSTILHDLTPNGYLGKRDLASGFHHVKLCPEARRFMGFRHPTTGELQRASVTLAGIRVRIYVYVDDLMLLGERHEDVRAAFDVLDEVGAELGLEWKASKDRGRDQSLQQLDFLGMLFDTVRMEMRM